MRGARVRGWLVATLVVLTTDRGDEAETWLRHAGQAGDTHAMTLRRMLLIATARFDEAETWLRLAAEADDPKAMNG